MIPDSPDAAFLFSSAFALPFLAQTEGIAQSTETDSKNVSLFNGQDLKGWHVDVPSLVNTSIPTPRLSSETASSSVLANQKVI